MSMFQALRDVVIMRKQSTLSRSGVRALADEGFVKRSIARHDCPALLSVDAFDEGCDVAKSGNVVDCGRYRGVLCHVKDATVADKTVAMVKSEHGGRGRFTTTSSVTRKVPVKAKP